MAQDYTCDVIFKNINIRSLNMENMKILISVATSYGKSRFMRTRILKYML
jgi:hypothetical protein